MNFISKTCPTGPMKSRECLAFFGVEYRAYLSIIIVSLLVGFSFYFIYSQIKNNKFETKNYLIKSLFISLIIFIILSVIIVWREGQKIY